MIIAHEDILGHTARGCRGNMEGSLSTKKLMKAALKSTAWGTGNAQTD